MDFNAAIAVKPTTHDPSRRPVSAVTTGVVFGSRLDGRHAVKRLKSMQRIFIIVSA